MDRMFDIGMSVTFDTAKTFLSNTCSMTLQRARIDYVNKIGFTRVIEIVDI